MRATLKSLLRLPFTARDLFNAGQVHLSNPPLPTDWRDELSKVRSNTGSSLLDVWRSQFESELKQIAEKPTWQAQRTQLLQLVIDHATWRTLYAAAADAEPRTWHHYLSNSPKAYELPEGERHPLIVRRYLLALMSQVTLMTLGSRLYGVDESKQREMDAYCAYERETRELDISMMQELFKAIDSGVEKDVQFIAELKDEMINPLIQEQVAILNIMAEQIVHSRLDVDSITSRIKKVHHAKQELALAIKPDLQLAASEKRDT
jgi:hypothetical protein